MLTAECFLHRRHLHRRQRGFESLVAALESGAINGLLEVIAGQHPPGVGHARFLRGLAHAARDLVANVLVVGSLAPQQAAKTDDGLNLAGLRQRPRRRRNFK